MRGSFFTFLQLLSPYGRFLLGQKGFRILADFFQIQALVAGTEDATAVGLAVEVVGFGHFRRCKEAVVFLEIRRQISVAVFGFRPLTGIVVLIRTPYKWLHSAIKMPFAGRNDSFTVLPN